MFIEDESESACSNMRRWRRRRRGERRDLGAENETETTESTSDSDSNDVARDPNAETDSVDAVLPSMLYQVGTVLICTLQFLHPFRILQFISECFHQFNTFTTSVHLRTRRRPKLLQWLRETLPSGRQVQDFTAVWRDGTILCDVIQTVVPGSCTEKLRKLHSHKSIQHSQILAARHLDVQPVFSHEDLHQMTFSSYLERRLVHYLVNIRCALFELQQNNSPFSRHLRSFRRTYSSVPEEDVIPLPLHIDCVVKGMGLVVAVQHRRASFYIYLLEIPSLYPFLVLNIPDIVVEIHGPNGDYGEIIIQNIQFRKIKKQINETSSHLINTKSAGNIPMNCCLTSTRIKVNYIPQSSGSHDLSVLRRGQHVPGSPYSVAVDRKVPGQSSGLSDDDDSSKSKHSSRRIKVILRIVDFINEKMILTDDGKLKELSPNSLVPTDHLWRQYSIYEFPERTDSSPESGDLPDSNDDSNGDYESISHTEDIRSEDSTPDNTEADSIQLTEPKRKDLGFLRSRCKKVMMMCSFIMKNSSRQKLQILNSASHFLDGRPVRLTEKTYQLMQAAVNTMDSETPFNYEEIVSDKPADLINECPFPNDQGHIRTEQPKIEYKKQEIQSEISNEDKSNIEDKSLCSVVTLLLENKQVELENKNDIENKNYISENLMDETNKKSIAIFDSACQMQHPGSYENLPGKSNHKLKQNLLTEQYLSNSKDLDTTVEYTCLKEQENSLTDVKIYTHDKDLELDHYSNEYTSKTSSTKESSLLSEIVERDNTIQLNSSIHQQNCKKESDLEDLKANNLDTNDQSPTSDCKADAISAKSILHDPEQKSIIEQCQQDQKTLPELFGKNIRVDELHIESVTKSLETRNIETNLNDQEGEPELKSHTSNSSISEISISTTEGNTGSLENLDHNGVCTNDISENVNPAEIHSLLDDTLQKILNHETQIGIEHLEQDILSRGTCMENGEQTRHKIGESVSDINQNNNSTKYQSDTENVVSDNEMTANEHTDGVGPASASSPTRHLSVKESNIFPNLEDLLSADFTAYMTSSGNDQHEHQFHLWPSDIAFDSKPISSFDGSEIDFESVLAAPNLEEALRKFEQGLKTTINEENKRLSDVEEMSETSQIEDPSPLPEPIQSDESSSDREDIADINIQGEEELAQEPADGENASYDIGDSDYISMDDLQSSVKHSPENRNNDDAVDSKYSDDFRTNQSNESELRSYMVKNRAFVEDMGPAEKEIWGISDKTQKDSGQINDNNNDTSKSAEWDSVPLHYKYYSRILTPTPMISMLEENENGRFSSQSENSFIHLDDTYSKQNDVRKADDNIQVNKIVELPTQDDFNEYHSSTNSEMLTVEPTVPDNEICKDCEITENYEKLVLSNKEGSIVSANKAELFVTELSKNNSLLDLDYVNFNSSPEKISLLDNDIVGKERTTNEIPLECIQSLHTAPAIQENMFNSEEMEYVSSADANYRNENFQKNDVPIGSICIHGIEDCINFNTSESGTDCREFSEDTLSNDNTPDIRIAGVNSVQLPSPFLSEQSDALDKTQNSIHMSESPSQCEETYVALNGEFCFVNDVGDKSESVDIMDTLSEKQYTQLSENTALISKNTDIYGHSSEDENTILAPIIMYSNHQAPNRDNISNYQSEMNVEGNDDLLYASQENIKVSHDEITANDDLQRTGAITSVLYNYHTITNVTTQSQVIDIEFESNCSDLLTFTDYNEYVPTVQVNDCEIPSEERETIIEGHAVTRSAWDDCRVTNYRKQTPPDTVSLPQGVITAGTDTLQPLVVENVDTETLLAEIACDNKLANKVDEIFDEIFESIMKNSENTESVTGDPEEHSAFIDIQVATELEERSIIENEAMSKQKCNKDFTSILDSSLKTSEINDIDLNASPPIKIYPYETITMNNALCISDDFDIEQQNVHMEELSNSMYLNLDSDNTFLNKHIYEDDSADIENRETNIQTIECKNDTSNLTTLVEHIKFTNYIEDPVSIPSSTCSNETSMQTNSQHTPNENISVITTTAEPSKEDYSNGFPTSMRVNQRKQYWDEKFQQTYESSQINTQEARNKPRKLMTYSEMYRNVCNKYQDTATVQRRQPSIRIAGIVNKWKNAFEKQELDVEMKNDTMEVLNDNYNKNIVSHWKQYWNHLAEHQSEKVNYKREPCDTVSEELINMTGLVGDGRLRFENTYNEQFLDVPCSTNNVTEEHKLQINVHVAETGSSSSLDMDIAHSSQGNNMQQAFNPTFDCLETIDLHSNENITEIGCDSSYTQTNVTAEISNNTTRDDIYRARLVHITEDGYRTPTPQTMLQITNRNFSEACKTFLKSSGPNAERITSTQTTEPIQLFEREKAEIIIKDNSCRDPKECIPDECKTRFERAKQFFEILEKREPISPTNRRRHRVSECNWKVNKSIDLERDSEDIENYKKSWGSTPTLERIQTEIEFNKISSNTSNKKKRCKRCGKMKRKKRKIIASSSAPTSDTETNLRICHLKNKEDFGGSERISRKKVSERFHVKDLFKDVIGETDSSNGSFLKGIPHREAVVASLRSFNINYNHKINTECNEIQDEPENMGLELPTTLQPQSYQPEYPYVPITPPRLYRPRYSLQTKNFITRQQLLDL